MAATAGPAAAALAGAGDGRKRAHHRVAHGEVRHAVADGRDHPDPLAAAVANLRVRAEVVNTSSLQPMSASEVTPWVAGTEAAFEGGVARFERLVFKTTTFKMGVKDLRVRLTLVSDSAPTAAAAAAGGSVLGKHPRQNDFDLSQVEHVHTREFVVVTAR